MTTIRRASAGLLAAALLAGTVAVGGGAAATPAGAGQAPATNVETAVSSNSAGPLARVPRSPRCSEALTPLETLRADSWFRFPDQLRLLGRSVSVDLNTFQWHQGPFLDPSRKLWYESLMWLAWGAALAKEDGRSADFEAAKNAALRVLAATPDPGSATPASRERMAELSWDRSQVWRRLQALNCLADSIGVEPLRPYLVAHANALLDPWRYLGPPQYKIQNRGVLSNLVLLDVGKRLGVERFQNAALARLNNEASQVFTAKGMTLEGSSHYHKVLVLAWEEAARALKRAGRLGTAARLDNWVSAAYEAGAHFISPTGQPTLIGNARPEDGFLRPPPNNRPLIFQDDTAGFAAGRWSWTDRNTSYWTARNSPKSGGHAHKDSMSVTWQARGTPILTDPGQPDYQYTHGPTNNPITLWSRQARAHNVALPNGRGPDLWKLRGTDISRTKGVDRLQLISTIRGMKQTRDIVIDHRRATLLASDHAPKKQQQLWHFDPAWSVASATENSAILVHSSGPQLEVTTNGVLSHLKGSLNPIKGLHTVQFERVVPAVELSIEGGRNTDTQFRMLPADKPQPPDITSKSQAQAKSVVLELPERVKGAKYLVQQRAETGEWQTIAPFTKFPKGRLTIDGLKNGVTESFRVATYSAEGISDFSAVTKLTPRTTPKRITEPSAEPKGSRKLLLRWEPPSFDGGNDVTSYLVSVGRRGEVQETTKRKLKFRHEDLTELKVLVQAVNDAGPGKRKKIQIIRKPKRNKVKIS